MNIAMILESDTFYITEGLTFFKNSKRLSSLASKMERNLSYASNEQEREEISEYIKNLKEAAQEFSNIEAKYTTGNKIEAKAEYDKLRVRYFKLMKDINTETMKKFLLGAGLYVGIAILLNAFPVGVSGEQMPTGLDAIRKQISINNSQISSIKSSTKQLAIMEKNMGLMEKLQREMSRLQRKMPRT